MPESKFMSVIPDYSTHFSPFSGDSNGQNPQLRRFSAEQYDLMIKSGILGENDRVELINGAIVEKIPKGTLHSATTDRISRLFFRVLGDKVVVRNQNPIQLDEFSQPEPDIVLASPSADDYALNHPNADDILLIIEVADSSLFFDRETKGEAYARAGIVQFLIVNLQDECVEDYREPVDGRYQKAEIAELTEALRLVSFPAVCLHVSELLPVKKQ